MPVYAIRAGENGPVKFGHAKAPLARLTAFQTPHYEILRLVRLWEGAFREEQKLHLLFADLRIMGEWFSWSQRVMGDVGLTVIPLPGDFDFITVASMRSSDVFRATSTDTGHTKILTMDGKSALAKGFGSLTADQIIKAMGGATCLSQRPELSAKRSTVANWPIDGIPARHWPVLARLARTGPDTAHITMDALERHTFPAKAQPAATEAA